MMIASQVQPTEMEFMIPRENYNIIKEAMTESKYFTYITFDSMGIMVKVVADIFNTP